MKGIARIAITIMSQSRCLRSNFIITAPRLAAGNHRCKSVAPAPAGGVMTRTESNASSALGTAKRLQGACRFLNDLPSLAQMLFCSEHIPETDPHDCPSEQFCLRKVRTTGCVDSLYDVAV